MIETIVKGCVIGILVSAPMGPVNMLCVQRTLNRGRWHGFFTGLGAMVSDVVYAFITLLGMSLVEDFLRKNEMLIQLIGSLILIVFGYFVFRANPLKGWTPVTKNEETHYFRDFITSFVFTLSNVTIIFVFITLYARFTFTPVTDGNGHLMLALASIAIGALVWWFFLSSFISMLRKHFNRKGLVILNKIVGSILIIISVVGILFSVFGITI
ncbi:LysE family translocator [Petrimonas sp.]|uniref:LysE family translocator n=1 Tax=Petrimonas sp. TaxID=2023866 RepID=UPI003F5125DB